jgi:cell division septum initiation protein DivIVA
MSDLAKTQPEFTAAIRGYDRLQVDEYVERLLQLLAEAEQRARDAEDDLEFSRHATVGPRVSQIFDLAVAEAQDVRERVNTEAEAQLADAREHAERLVAAAHDDDADIRERTEQQRQVMLAEMEHEREAASARLSALEERRAKLLRELKQLHDALGSAAAGIVQEEVDSAVLSITNADEETATRELPVGRDEGAEHADTPLAPPRRARAAG